VVVKLIIQKKNKEKLKNTRFRNNKKFSLLVNVLELLLRHPTLVWCTSRSSDVVSPGDWLMSSIWSFYTQG
jgi:hypothetical protein